MWWLNFWGCFDNCNSEKIFFLRVININDRPDRMNVQWVIHLSIICMFRKVAVLVLVLVIAMTSFVTPASASEGFSEKEPFTIELAKEGAKAAVIFLTPLAICFAADAIATGVFPPAAALAPYCAALAIPVGTGGAVASGAAGSMNVAQKAMAH